MLVVSFNKTVWTRLLNSIMLYASRRAPKRSKAACRALQNPYKDDSTAPKRLSCLRNRAAVCGVPLSGR